MSFRENLKELLIFKELQVKELATLTGIKKRTLDNYLRETGAMPSAENAVRIARALGVTAEYLVMGENLPGEKPAFRSREANLIIEQLANLSGEQCRALFGLIKSFKAEP
jgi:transcriptional regulator with XRE-family HTH domain